MIDKKPIRQSEILELIVERRTSAKKKDANIELVIPKMPLKINSILEDNIKPNKEEYVQLNDFDRRINASHSTAIGNVYSNFTAPSGTTTSLNRSVH
jgi:hypothetical protein